MLPERIYLAENPRETLVRPTLGLALFLDDERAWAERHAAELLASFLERIEPRRLLVYSTSTLGRWRPVDHDRLDELVGNLALPELLPQKIRHLFQLRIADDPFASGLGFSYREIDGSERDQTGSVQIDLPVRTDPDELLALAIEVAQRFPIRLGLAGYSVTWNPYVVSDAFEVIHGWCRRCLGLDVLRPDLASWRLRQGLPGVRWITMIGSRAARDWGLDLSGLQSKRWQSDVAVMPLAGATLIRAGAAPELGDANALEFPAALAEVAWTLGPHLLDDPPELPGPFEREALTRAWLHRFSAPEDWA